MKLEDPTENITNPLLKDKKDLLFSPEQDFDEPPEKEDDEENEDDDFYRDYIEISFTNGLRIDLGSAKYDIKELKLILFEILEYTKNDSKKLNMKELQYCG